MLAREKSTPPPQGFTLIELMIAVAILAILTTISAPSFRELIANYRARTAAEGILNGLQLARTEAIHRNANTSFTLNTGSGWTVASGGAQIQNRPASESGSSVTVTTNGDSTSVTFTPIGAVANYSSTTTLKQITISHPGAADSYQIDVFSGGAMRMCSPQVTVSNDPRRC